MPRRALYWSLVHWRDLWLVAFTLLTFWTIHAARQETQRTKAAFCTFRGGYVESIHQADAFLKKHPHGAFGFTRAEILANRQTQQDRVDSLSGLNCPRKENP